MGSVADHLTIMLDSWGSDRNYAVFMVVEQLPAVSGQWWYTAVHVPINGQSIAEGRYRSDYCRSMRPAKTIPVVALMK